MNLQWEQQTTPRTGTRPIRGVEFRTYLQKNYGAGAGAAGAGSAGAAGGV
jgi:hypothetical protein